MTHTLVLAAGAFPTLIVWLNGVRLFFIFASVSLLFLMF